MKFALWEKWKAAVERYDDTHNFTCDVCGREVFDGRRVCASCRESLPANDGNICPFCGRKVQEAGACLLCKVKPLGVRKARSPYLYADGAIGLVMRFKRGHAYLARAFAELSLPIAEREFEHVDMLVPVPMSEKALKKRGYNQSERFAYFLAKAWGKEVYLGAQKRRETSAQKTLGRKEREENLTGSFHIADRKAVKGKDLLIIDDVMTTGATISVLADALKRAGAANLYALTFTSVEQFVLSEAQRSGMDRKPPA